MAVDYAAATVLVGSTTYTLLELMKKRLCIMEPDQDAVLSLYLQIAGESAEAYCGTVLALQSVSEQFDQWGDGLGLRHVPASELTTVDVDGDDVTANWELRHRPGSSYIETTYSGDQSADGDQMTVTYQAGYSPLPTDLGNTLVNAALAYSENGGAGSGVVRRESVVGVGAVEYATDNTEPYGAFSGAGISTLDRYVRKYA